MGYDINYIPIEEVEGYTTSDEIMQDDKFSYYGSSYLSYNFSNKALTGEEFKDYFYLPDIAGQRVEKIASILKSVLKKLKKEGHEAYIPNETWKSTWDEVTTVKLMDGWTPDMRVYTYHVKRLIQECENNPNTVMVLDYSHPIRINEDEYTSLGDETEN